MGNEFPKSVYMFKIIARLLLEKIDLFKDMLKDFAEGKHNEGIKKLSQLGEELWEKGKTVFEVDEQFRNECIALLASIMQDEIE